MKSIKKLAIPVLFAAFGAMQAQAQTSDAIDPSLLKLMGVYGPHSAFAGPYVGAKLGMNWSDATGYHPRSTHSTFFPGLVAGVNYDVGPMVLGVEGFMDFHEGSTTKKDGGIDARIGMPLNNVVMPYARIGFTGTSPDTRFHYGVGTEYKFAKNWSVAGEYTADTSHYDGGHRRNDSVTVGVHYYFF